MAKTVIPNVNPNLKFLIEQIATEMGAKAIFKWQSIYNKYIEYTEAPVIDVNTFVVHCELIGSEPDINFVEYLYYKYEKVMSDLERDMELEVADRLDIKQHKRKRKSIIVKKNGEVVNYKGNK